MDVREVSTGYQVPRNFKQTDIGLLPIDWTTAPLAREFEVQLGKMLDAEKNTGFEKPFIGNRAVQWGRIETIDVGLIKLAPSELSRFRLRKGDLLVCEGGEVGRCAIWSEPLPECYFQKALHRLRPKNGYDVDLLANVLRLYSTNGFLANYVTQTSIAHLPKDKFECIPIPLPPTRHEQRAIAEALSDADALIESLSLLLAKKRQIKQGAMQELLTGKKRLPGFQASWKRSPLGKLLSVRHGRSQKLVESESAKYPILASGGRIGWASQFLHDKPSVLIGRKGTIDEPQYMETPFWSVDTLFYSEVQHPNVAKFLFYRFCLIDWMRHNEASGVPSLSAKVIESIEIDHPERDEQQAITDALSDMDAEIDGVEARLKKVRDIKQGMMQMLLTGRIRLVQPA